MNQSRIIGVGRMSSMELLQNIMERLRELGHEVTFYEDSSAFHHAVPRLTDVDAVVAAPSFFFSRALMTSANRLRGVVSPVTGIDRFDIAAATDLGIVIADGQTSENTESMAEATILLVLAAIYDLHGAETETVLRQNLPRPAQMSARMLRNKTVGLIGFGQIVRAVAGRLIGWNLTIQAYTRRIRDDDPHCVHFVGLDDLLRTSDVVCVLSTLNDESRNLLNADRLRLLKKDAVLVNTARGAIIDEAALYEMATQRPDLRLALDTFTTEPLPPQSPLRDLPNTILTPHMLGHTQESLAALPDIAIENVQRILAGQLPADVCNPDVVTRWQTPWG